MPLNLTIVNQMAQPVTNMLIVLGSALLGAIVGGASTYLANSRIENRRMKIQAYSQLKARKRAIGQIYFSHIEAKLRCKLLSILRELGTPGDPMFNDEYMRWIKREGELIIKSNEYYEMLLEIMTLVELSFKRSPELEQRVDEIERLNESVIDHVENRVQHFEERIRDTLRLLPREVNINLNLEPGHVQVIRTYNAGAARSLTDPIMNEMYGETRNYINTNIEWPIDNLLIYLDRELNGEDNEALQAWRVRISP